MQAMNSNFLQVPLCDFADYHVSLRSRQVNRYASMMVGMRVVLGRLVHAQAKTELHL